MADGGWGDGGGKGGGVGHFGMCVVSVVFVVGGGLGLRVGLLRGVEEGRRVRGLQVVEEEGVSFVGQREGGWRGGVGWEIVRRWS